MTSSSQSLFSVSVRIAAAVVAAFLFAIALPAVAQRSADRPDLKITQAQFDGRNLHVEYINTTGVGYPKTRYEVGFQWYDASGQSLGSRRWIPVPEVERGGVSILDSKYRIDLSYKRNDGRIYGEQLSYFIAQRPGGAAELRVTVDDGDRVSETDETNNMASLKFLLPDLQITSAKFMGANRVELQYRNANPAAITYPFRLGFTWVDDAGAAVAEMRWVEAFDPTPVGSAATVSTVRRYASYIGSGGRMSTDRLDWYLERRPAQASQLKIAIDESRTVAESDEQNNVVLLRPILPDLVIKYVDFGGDKLTFSYGNEGDGYIRDTALRVVFQWMDAAGQPVGDPRWHRFVQMDPRQMFSVRADQFDVEYAMAGTNRATTERLGSYIRRQPADAVQFRIMIDDEGKLLESNEQNNIASFSVAPPPKSDLVIRDAVFADGRLTFTASNTGVGTARGPVSFWFEWVNADGERELGPFWFDTPHDLMANEVFTVDSAKLRVWGTALRGSGRIEEHPAAKIFSDPPVGVVALKLLIDGPGRIAETNERNNIIVLTLPTPPPPVESKPDLAVGAVEVRDGALFITVRNVGIGNAAGTDIWLMWFSAKGALPVSGAVDLPAIVAGKEVTVRVPFDGKTEISQILREPPRDGTRVRIFLDGGRKVEELNEQNNDGWLDRVKLPPPAPEPQAKPDLRISEHRFDAERFAIVIANDGALMKSGFNWTLEWVDAEGRRVDRGYPIYHQPITAARSARWDEDLKTSPYGSRTYILAPPTDAAFLQISLDVSKQVEESNEENNTLRIPRPSFLGAAGTSKKALTVRANGTPQRGEAPIIVQFRAEVSGGKSPYTATWTFGDQSNESRKGEVVQYTYAKAGTYVATVTVRDAVGAEVKSDIQIKVLEEKRRGPDLTVEEIIIDPHAPRSGDIVTFAVRVANRGSQGVGEVTVTRLELDRGNDKKIDHPFTQVITSPLAANGKQTHEWNDRTSAGYHWIAVAGTHRLIACADRLNVIEEQDERNNCLERMLTVAPAEPEKPKQPDLAVIDIIITPAKPVAGEKFTVGAIVKNIGGAAAPASVVSFVMDIDNDDDPEQLPDNITVPSFARGQTRVVRWDDAQSAPAGTHGITVCVDIDEEIDEMDEDDNCVDRTVTVGGAMGMAPSPRFTAVALDVLARIIFGGLGATPIVAGESKEFDPAP